MARLGFQAPYVRDQGQRRSGERGGEHVQTVEPPRPVPVPVPVGVPWTDQTPFFSTNGGLALLSCPYTPRVELREGTNLQR